MVVPSLCNNMRNKTKKKKKKTRMHWTSFVHLMTSQAYPHCQHMSLIMTLQQSSSSNSNSNSSQKQSHQAYLHRRLSLPHFFPEPIFSHPLLQRKEPSRSFRQQHRGHQPRIAPVLPYHPWWPMGAATTSRNRGRCPSSKQETPICFFFFLSLSFSPFLLTVVLYDKQIVAY